MFANDRVLREGAFLHQLVLDGIGWTIGGVHEIVNWMELEVRMAGTPNIAGLAITPEVLKFVSGIDEFKGAWRAIGRIAPERLSALRRVATIESAASSTRIEGAKLTDREVELLLSNLDIKSFTSRDEQEVAGYADAMEMVFTSWGAIDLTENHVRQLHRDLLKYSTKDERHRGEYKTLPNDVAAFDVDGKKLGVVFETTTPFTTPGQTAALIAWTAKALSDQAVHPLIIIAVFIVSFLAIHPFQDGNGRLSRILTTLLLLRGGYAYVPYSSLESVVEQTKERYYIALRQTQGTIRTDKPDWQPWLGYFLGVLTEQKLRLDKKIARERILLGRLPELSVQILELCRERGHVTISDIVKATGASRNTIKDHVTALVDKAHLVRHGAGRGTWYALS
jgi:Fic family protein